MIAHFSDLFNCVYFETKPKLNSNQENEFVLPIDEKDDKFSLKLIDKFIDFINKTHEMESKIFKYFSLA